MKYQLPHVAFLDNAARAIGNTLLCKSCGPYDDNIPGLPYVSVPAYQADE